ncbi:monosaccharide-sensing protein 2 [Tripterygium wilfordii]|uniref:Monosaccharide-sensing protein 2 n=1 Tax=Tripterygium wilfordii TaxID=458696 RepID=A0A7J7E3T6_TRIWF|nr:monosaccharide-sensing protein 2-like [Tripterygium wilfordii]KAF5753114.1 monosaccharide-sensing protein 2 [Tripterygium wilfordii]
MRGAVLVALVATVGNLLQGWDSSTVAGSVLYIKREFNLQTQPAIEGLIIAMSLIGATFITTFSGPVSDFLGRRPMLIMSSVLYFLSGLTMLWAPNVYVVLLGRLIDGFGIGLAITLIPVYISEIAPPDIRGQLGTLTQLMSSGGMLLSYCMVFGMSLMHSPSWRLMGGFITVPALIYFVFTVFYLPESPRWLVSKGRTIEAKQILQRLLGKEDVSGEMAMLVEGLEVGNHTRIEEYIITPAYELTDDHETTTEKDQIKLYGLEEGKSWIAKPVSGQSRQGSSAYRSLPLMDPLINIFESMHENLSTAGSMQSTTNSISSVSGNLGQTDCWDLEKQIKDTDHQDCVYAPGKIDSDYNIRTPFLPRQGSDTETDRSHSVEATVVGGGWQLAWKWSENEGEDGKRKERLQKVYLHRESTLASLPLGSSISISGDDLHKGHEVLQAAALVSQSAFRPKDPSNHPPIGPPVVQPLDIAASRPSWTDLFEPGVRWALIVGVGLQVLQQISGINAVLYYAPQILKQAGVAVILSNLGLGTDSASLLISACTTLLMLPCIATSMRLMDVSGRRSILLATIPILVVSLAVLIISNTVSMGAMVNAIISTASVVVYSSCFVMGFGVIPNMLCAEIFPTCIRGVCIALCALTSWIGNMIITYTFPIMLNTLGLAGVCSIYTVGCILSWIFVFLRVPETKGTPLEVIPELFAAGAATAPRSS